jgi:hypothetical protein
VGDVPPQYGAAPTLRTTALAVTSDRHMMIPFDLGRALEMALHRFIDKLGELTLPVAGLGMAAIVFTAFVQYLGRLRSGATRSTTRE